MKKQQLIIQFFTVILIFIIFFFFRFYNLDKRIIFDWDQEQFSNQIKNIIVNHKLTLLGPRVFSDKGFFLGPYFTYLLIPFYLISNLHPQGFVYFIIFYNIIFFALSYLILKKIFALRQSLVFLFLWAVNFLLIEYDIIPWNPVFIPLGVVVTWLILYKIFKKNATKDWLSLGLVLGFFINMHFQFIFIILFSAFFLVLYQIKKKAFDFKKIIVAKLSFLAMFIPLFIFDLRHNFLNTRVFFDFFFSKGDTIGSDHNVWLTVFTIFLQPFIFWRSSTLAGVFYFSLLLIIIYLYKSRRKFFQSFYFATIILWIIFPVFFALYGKRPSEYYFVFLFPFILISITDFIFSVKKPYLMFIVCIFFFLINFKTVYFNLRPNLFGLFYKDKAVRELKKLTINKKFNISFDVPLGTNNGYNYLIDYYLIKQTGNWNDPLVQIRIPPKKNDVVVEKIGLKIPKEL